MPSVGLESAPLTRWTGEAFRLIPSRFPPVNVYEGLIANDRQGELVAVENLTNPRLRSLDRLSSTLKSDAAADPRLQNWNLAPFAYGNPDGSLFFGEDRPCLEMAAERQTALAISVARRQTFMKATAEGPIGLDMRMLCTPVSGLFWDLRHVVSLPADLPKKDWRDLGTQMPPDAQGILFRPPERPAGTSLIVVTGDVLQRSQQTAHFRYMWDGRSIALLYAFDNKGTPIEAAALAGDEDILVAA